MITDTVRPKESKTSLEVVPNTYAVQNGLIYDYYPVRLGKAVGKSFVDISKSPPILQEGYVSINKKIYKVTLSDLFRRRVDVREPYQCAATSAASEPSGQEVAVASTVDPNNESGISQTLGLPVNEVVDLHWKNQIDTLLDFED